MTSINLHRQGTGDPVVLVHGLGSRWQVFEPVIDRLAARREVIAVDLPGFGASPLLPGVEPGPRGYADWLTGWLAAEGIARPHVVGNSMGGGIALELGRRGVASRVTAFSPIGFFDTAGVRWCQGLLTALRVASRHTGPVIDRAVEHRLGRALLFGTLVGHPTRVPPEAGRADVAGLVGATAFAAARDSFDDYRITPTDDHGALPTIPVTIAWGTRDVLLTHRTQSRRARAALPFARHVDLPGAGHLPFNDDPERCARLILEETP